MERCGNVYYVRTDHIGTVIARAMADHPETEIDDWFVGPVDGQLAVYPAPVRDRVAA